METTVPSKYHPEANRVRKDPGAEAHRPVLSDRQFVKTVAAERQERKALEHELKAGKTFRRTGKHLKKAAKHQRRADRTR